MLREYAIISVHAMEGRTHRDVTTNMDLKQQKKRQTRLNLKRTSMVDILIKSHTQARRQMIVALRTEAARDLFDRTFRCIDRSILAASRDVR